VAVDGSKFRAVNSRDRSFTKGKIASRIAHVEAGVERYIEEMVRLDGQEEGEVRAAKVAYLAKRYGRIRQQIKQLQAMDMALSDAPNGQISLTDTDARAIATSARNSGMDGYNAQTVVDAGTHLIVPMMLSTKGTIATFWHQWRRPQRTPSVARICMFSRTKVTLVGARSSSATRQGSQRPSRAPRHLVTGSRGCM
jgi:hypothetical protein